MGKRTFVISVIVHVLLAASLVGIAKERARRRPVAVALAEAKQKEKPKAKPQPPPPPPPVKVAKARVEPKAAAEAKAPAPSAPKAAAAAPVATALEMSNFDASPGGIALPSKAAAAAPAAATKVASAISEARKQRQKAELGAGPSGDAPCEEEPTKPEPVFKTEIEYTAAARAEGVEGKLKLKLTIGADGSVSQVEVLSGVWAELDAAAVAAAKQWRFKPAMACGKAVEGGTYILARRFELGD